MKNVCRCPEPPGGEAKCPPDRLAVCRIVQGRIQTDCLGPPPAGVTGTKRGLVNWVLAAVTRDQRPLYQPVRAADMDLINEALRAGGEVETLDAYGAAVTFRLSRNMMAVLSRDDEIRGSGSSSPALA